MLEELAGAGVGPLPGLVLEWRELSKLKGTYVDALPRHVAKDGRIHTRFDQAVAATGRLSSNDPNLQNIPVRTEAGREIRKAFVAPPGRLLVAADYSQIELRLLAHLSRRRRRSSRRSAAARTSTAPRRRRSSASIPGSSSSDQRRGAKTINFGILYGMGAVRPRQPARRPAGGGKDVHRVLLRTLPVDPGLPRRDPRRGPARPVRRETIFGRLRPIPEIVDRDHAVRANAERMAMNAPIQGSAADLIKLAMVELDRRLASAFPSARMLLQVHDELVLECDAADAPGVAAPREGDDGRGRRPRRTAHGRHRERRQLGGREIAGATILKMALSGRRFPRPYALFLPALLLAPALFAQAPVPLETIPDPARIPAAEVPFVNPLWQELEAPAALKGPVPKLKDLEAASTLIVGVRIDETGKVSEAVAPEPPLRALGAAAQAQAPRWIFKPAKKDGQPVRCWGTYGVDVEVELEDAVWSAFNLVAVGRDDPLPALGKEFPGDTWISRYPAALVPPEPGVLSVEDVDFLPMPEKVPLKFESTPLKSRALALVEVTGLGTVEARRPGRAVRAAHPPLGPREREGVGPDGREEGGRPVTSWLALDTTIEYSLGSVKERGKRSIKKNLRGVPLP